MTLSILLVGTLLTAATAPAKAAPAAKKPAVVAKSAAKAKPAPVKKPAAAPASDPVSPRSIDHDTVPMEWGDNAAARWAAARAARKAPVAKRAAAADRNSEPERLSLAPSMPAAETSLTVRPSRTLGLTCTIGGSALIIGSSLGMLLSQSPDRSALRTPSLIAMGVGAAVFTTGMWRLAVASPPSAPPKGVMGVVPMQGGAGVVYATKLP